VRVPTRWPALSGPGENPHLTSSTAAGEGAAVPPSVGFGLLGLRERVALLGGELEFGAGPAGGSRLSVTVPIHTQEVPAK